MTAQLIIHRRKLHPLWGLLFACVSVCILTFGDLPLPQVLEGVHNRLLGNSTDWNALLDERLPRLIVLLCTGAGLAVSGTVMQSLFHNPLASPSVLGISAGGSLCVVLVFISHWHLSYPYAIPIAAFSGCLATLLAVYTISQRRGGVSIQSLVLTGIAMSTLIIAIQGAIMYALRDHWQLVQTVTEWSAGTTADRGWKHVHMQLPLTLIGLWGCWYYAREIDILALGDEEATNLGVDVRKVRWRLFLCIALLTGGALATVGIIAFFGLVLPHLLRKWYGPQNTLLVPYCILFGSTSLAAMDLLLRIYDIHHFSIGNVSAILGGLFFFLLLFRTGGRDGFNGGARV